MAVRFNPPPGWQVPPGFRPDASWVPDPSWPPAPQGWEYWISEPDTAPPVTPPAPEPPSGTPAAPSSNTAPTPDMAPSSHAAPTPDTTGQDPARTAAPANASAASPIDELTVRRLPGEVAATEVFDDPAAGLTTDVPRAGGAGMDETMIRPPLPGNGGPAPREDTSTMALETLPGPAGPAATHMPGQVPPGQARPGPPLPPGMPAGQGAPGGQGYGSHGMPAGPGAPGPGGPGGPAMLPPHSEAPKSSVAAMGQNLLGTIKGLGKPRPQQPVPAQSIPVGPGGPMAPGPGMHGPGGQPPAGRPGGARGGARPPGSPLLIGVGIAGAALGVIIGIVVTAGLQADANQAMTNAELIRSEVAAEREQIDKDLAQLKKQRDEVAQREQELSKRESELTKNERELNEQREQQEQQQQEDDQQDNGNGNGGFQFFFTCDDVRAAGRAPLAESDPSYRWDLDRNSNGLACEDGE